MAARTRADVQSARIERARQRRLELDKDREAKGARVDAAVADVYLAQEERDEAVAVIERLDAAMGEAIIRILAEGVAIARVAELTGLTANQVQRLKSAASDAPEPARTDPTGDAPATWPAAPEGCVRARRTRARFCAARS